MNHLPNTLHAALYALCLSATACGAADESAPALSDQTASDTEQVAEPDNNEIGETGEMTTGTEADAGAPTVGDEGSDSLDGTSDNPADAGAAPNGPDAGSDNSGNTIPDAGSNTDSDAGAEPEVDAGGLPCNSPVVYYVDHDRDGFGGLVSVTACEQPFYTTPRDGELDTGPWVTVAGDCQDDNDEVHPEATGAFEDGYTAVGGGLSWDYNCDGVEVTTFAEFEGCTQVGQQCTGFGWRAVGTRRSLTAEPGSVTDHCGSNQQVSCSIRQSGGCQENLFITTVAACI